MKKSLPSKIRSAENYAVSAQRPSNVLTGSVDCAAVRRTPAGQSTRTGRLVSAALQPLNMCSTALYPDTASTLSSAKVKSSLTLIPQTWLRLLQLCLCVLADLLSGLLLPPDLGGPATGVPRGETGALTQHLHARKDLEAGHILLQRQGEPPTHHHRA